jgi:two-component system, chemotaxis family, protein-glutamate methylesterase/glutaminase
MTPSDKIRVFLVDDASAVRRLVTNALNQDPALEVVGTAADGQMALARLAELRPDVVLLDLEMPVMDGLETLVALRKTHPRLPVIMFSRLTQRGVEATVRALTLGADDYVPKPGDGLDVAGCIEGQLIPKIKLLGRLALERETPGLDKETRRQPDKEKEKPPCRSTSPRQRVEIVVIGASTGGPNALTELLPAFPPDWSIPIVIVQHMLPDFTARLAERLSEKSRLRVREGISGELVTASQAWVAPGGYHLLVRREGKGIRLALDQGPPVNSCRPAVDVLFRSAAEVYGPGALAVVLTGLGQDGLAGCESLRAVGGQVLVQDQASSAAWSMPGAVAQAGLADQVLPLEQLGPEVLRRADGPRPASKVERRCP